MRPDDMPPQKIPRCPGRILTRRDFLGYMGSAAGAAAMAASAPSLISAETLGAIAPRSVVSIGLCKRYEFAAVKKALGHMLDEVGGVGRLVKNKRVTVKLNLVNSSEADIAGVPLCLTVTVHPVVALALGRLLVEYGAKSVVFCDQLPFKNLGPEAFKGYGFDSERFQQVMEGRVSFENTRNRGRYDSYALAKVPDGGYIAQSWEVNRTYVDTDVLVSLTKLKSHVSGGITGSMKNLFGLPPSSLYGDDLDGQPDENASAYRTNTMHNCSHKPKTSVDGFTGKTVKGDHGHNVPRFIVDLNSAFPVHLGVVDGISTIQTAEGWWLGSMVSITRPGLLLAGRNPVCLDAAAAGVMGFNPDAADRSWPFVNGSNHLRLAREKGLGENRLKQIEIAGVALDVARHEFQPTFRRIAP